MKIVNKEEFESTINNNSLVLVDFFANWCGPCKMVAPVLEEIANEDPNVTIIKVDVDQESALAGKFGVQSIPNMIIFKDGHAVDQIIGFTNKQGIVEKIAAHK